MKQLTISVEEFPYEVAEVTQYSMLQTKYRYFSVSLEKAIERAGKLIADHKRVSIIDRVTGKVIWHS